MAFDDKDVAVLQTEMANQTQQAVQNATAAVGIGTRPVQPDSDRFLLVKPRYTSTPGVFSSLGTIKLDAPYVYEKDAQGKAKLIERANGPYIEKIRQIARKKCDEWQLPKGSFISFNLEENPQTGALKFVPSTVNAQNEQGLPIEAYNYDQLDPKCSFALHYNPPITASVDDLVVE